jgi:hypothetical protein
MVEDESQGKIKDEAGPSNQTVEEANAVNAVNGLFLERRVNANVLCSASEEPTNCNYPGPQRVRSTTPLVVPIIPNSLTIAPCITV